MNGSGWTAADASELQKIRRALEKVAAELRLIAHPQIIVSEADPCPPACTNCPKCGSLLLVICSTADLKQEPSRAYPDPDPED